MAKKSNADGAPDDGGKKKILLAVGALALAGGAYKFVLAPAPAAPADAVTPAAEVAPQPGETIELPEVVINLADPETRYARVGVALVLEEGIVAKDFEAESAIAKDVVLSYLSKLSYDQLREPATKDRAKDELSTLIRQAYGDAKVVRVLFTVLVMQ